MHTKLIKTSYNQVAAAYNRNRQELKSTKYLNKLLTLLPPQSSVLDLGCGAGIPVDTTLTAKGHLVTGLDISKTQISLARKNCPRGDFQLKDISSLKPRQYAVAAVVSFYAIFHIPREKHSQLLQTINSFLPIGGYLLLTMGDRNFEGFHNFFGVTMWSSHYHPTTNTKLVQTTGFKILLDELDTSGRENHQIILAQKINNSP